MLSKHTIVLSVSTIQGNFLKNDYHGKGRSYYSWHKLFKLFKSSLSFCLVPTPHQDNIMQIRCGSPDCSTYSTHKVYHQSVKLIIILYGIALFLSDFLVVAASPCQCDSSLTDFSQFTSSTLTAAFFDGLEFPYKTDETLS